MSNYLKDLEDSRLLFKTFCDGLMYGMFFYHGATLHRVVSIERLDGTINGIYSISKCRPCLRPMSLMTEEEKETYESFIISIAEDETGAWELIDWLNERHLDYRGLIEKGLALEAPENFYNN